MLVLHDDISTGKRCVAVEIVADGAYASTSHGFMVLCRHIAVLTNTNNLSPTGEDSLLSMDATMTNGQMTLTIVTSGSITVVTHILSSRRYCEPVVRYYLF